MGLLDFLFGKKKTKSIDDHLGALPTGGLTVMSLEALDFVIPGEWDNVTNFDALVAKVTGDDDAAYLEAVRQRARQLFEANDQGYQSALRIYRLVDDADVALGGAALADKVTGKIKLLSFLDRLTPKADTAQSLDLALKVVAELLAFTKINGIPGDSFADFVKALGAYSGESKMRMAALVCYDGLVPLGPDFVERTTDRVGSLSAADLRENKLFRRIEGLIPGADDDGKVAFVRKGVESVASWMTEFVGQRDLAPDKVLGSLGKFIEVSDDKLDYVGAFIDVSTNYFEHTGTQTLAARLVERASAEV